MYKLTQTCTFSKDLKLECIGIKFDNLLRFLSIT